MNANDFDRMILWLSNEPKGGMPMGLDVMEILIIKKLIFPISACVKKWKPFLARKKNWFYV